MSPVVVAVHRHPEHSFSKQQVDSIDLIAGIGVAGDAHAGPQVKHRSRVAADPAQPNLRQVHLMQSELFDDVGEAGHVVEPGALGENITTAGIDLLSLATGTVLRIGTDVLLAVTGLRNPCGQIEHFQPGLLDQVLIRTGEGITIRKAGVMAVVIHGGQISPGATIQVSEPPGPAVPLERV